MRLIDADEAYKVLTDYYHQRTEFQRKALKEALSRVPTVDAVPTDFHDKCMEIEIRKRFDAERHGHWKLVRNPMMYQTVPYVQVCSQCGTAFPYKMPYCGECGAKMDEVEDGKT